MTERSEAEVQHNINLMHNAVTSISDAIMCLNYLTMNVPCVKERVGDLAEIRGHIQQIKEFAESVKETKYPTDEGSGV